MKFRKPFSPNTRNIRPNRIRTMGVTMRPADFLSRLCVTTVCDAMSVIDFPSALRQIFVELFERPAPTLFHSVMSDDRFGPVFRQRFVLSVLMTNGFADSGQDSAGYLARTT